MSSNPHAKKARRRKRRAARDAAWVAAPVPLESYRPGLPLPVLN